MPNMVKIGSGFPGVKNVNKNALKNRQRILVITKYQLVFLKRNVINFEARNGHWVRRDTSQHGVFMTCKIMYNDMCSSAHTSSYYFSIESKKAQK